MSLYLSLLRASLRDSSSNSRTAASTSSWPVEGVVVVVVGAADAAGTGETCSDAC